MKTSKLMNIIKTKDLVIPSILLKNYKNLEINEKELLFLAYLMSYENIISFNPSVFSDTLGFTQEEIIGIIGNLSTKNYINMVVKQENGKMKEFLNIEELYNKLLVLTIDDEEQEAKEEVSSKIYEVIEKELGRTLSPIEYETISGWLNQGISEELIKEALKEAVLNGVNNLKYIDKILYEWAKKGYKKASDVRKKQKKEEVIEIFDYDWLDEND